MKNAFLRHCYKQRTSTSCTIFLISVKLCGGINDVKTKNQDLNIIAIQYTTYSNRLTMFSFLSRCWRAEEQTGCL